MFMRMRMLWVNARDSLWLIPSLLTLLGGGLALLLTRLERSGALSMGGGEHWFLGGGPEGAGAVLSAVSTGLITVTGVVFSVTVVALQLASSQFTPRLLRNFVADRSNQVVLGVFIGTFTYALLVLRVVESPSAGTEGFIPRAAVGVGVMLFLASVGFLVHFIHHASRSIRVPVIMERVARETIRNVESMFPERVADPADEQELEAPADTVVITSRRSGYLQAVDARALFEHGEEKQLVIRMERMIGDYVLPDSALATAWPPGLVDDGVRDVVRRAFVLGEERTPEQDIEFGIIEISDIAVKALSPGINDPRTAVHCIDRLADILLNLGTRWPPRKTRSREGRVHFIAQPLRFERAVGLAFDQIRHFGCANPTVVKKLIDSLTEMDQLLPESRRGPVRSQRSAVLADAKRAIGSDVDRSDIARALDESDPEEAGAR